MKRSDRDRLLREILTDDHVERLRTDSLAAMLVAARTRRRNRILVATTAASLALLVVIFALMRPEQAARPATKALVSASEPAVSSRAKIITDDQLLGRFPDGAVALIGRSGQQRLVFLNAPTDTRPTSRTP